MSCTDRKASIESFAGGTTQSLVTTNILSRGIDGQNVVLVVNFDVPESAGSLDAQSYLHRTGRCGRFGNFSSTFRIYSIYFIKYK